MRKIKMTLFEYAKSRPENEWLLDQFDYEKNAPYTPMDFGKTSNKRVYFTFPCGHTRLQCIADKTRKNSKKCPVCMNRGAVGKSLAEEYPECASMFMAEKNGITAERVTPHNGMSYWWKCNVCGHEFQGKVSDIVSGHRVCNMCSNSKISFPQYCLYFYLKKLDQACEINKKIEGYKFDVYLPRYNLAIEYDGYPWHNTESARKNDVAKDAICEKLGIHILRIRDSRLKTNNKLTSEIWGFDYDDGLSFFSGLLQELIKFGIDTKELDIDVKRDVYKIQEFRRLGEKKKSLLNHMPELSSFIDTEDERNGNPELINVASHSIRLWLRDPEHPALKWSLTVHELFQKTEPYAQRIKMCRKMLKRYPKLEEQIYTYGNEIRCNSTFKLRCSCGNEFEKNYTALMDKGKVELCPECICKFRLKNIGRL